MVNIARASIEKPLYTWLLILTMLLGGIWGFFNLGRWKIRPLPSNNPW